MFCRGFMKRERGKTIDLKLPNRFFIQVYCTCGIYEQKQFISYVVNIAVSLLSGGLLCSHI